MRFRTLIRRMALGSSLVLMAAVVVAAPPTYRLHVDGLACPFCTYGIEKKLGALGGVRGLETHIQDGAVIVTMEDGVTLDEASARQAVKEAGFSLRKFERLQSAPQGEPAGEAR